MPSQSYIGKVNLYQCASCRMWFGVDHAFDRARREDGKGFYCPAGHSLSYHEAEIDTLRSEKERASIRQRALEDQLRAAEADAEQRRLQLVRDRARFANGVCPCCDRFFENVARHMRGEHPGYDPSDLAAPRFQCSCHASFETLRGLRIHQGRMRDDDWTNPARSAYWRHLTVAESLTT